MAIEQGTGATTAYAANRYAPRGTRQYPLSAKQAAWLPALQDEAATLARSAYGLQIDALQLAPGGHTAQTRADAVAAVQTVANDAIRGIRAYRADTMTSGEFTMLVAIRDGLRTLERRNRAAVAAHLSHMAGRPVTGATPAAPAPSDTVEDGATYRAPDGRVFHAYLGQSGRLLVKLWTPGGEDTDGEGGAFAYYGAATRLPSGIVRMSTEECQDFGRATGTCAICMRHLTDDESVARGVGPICWGRVG